jgi:hypothetical protein
MEMINLFLITNLLSKDMKTQVYLVKLTITK